MRTTIILITVFFGLSKVALAEDDTFAIFAAPPNESDPPANAAPNYVIAPESVPTIRILPEDVVQDSVQQFRFTTNKYALKWSYTEGGAKKVLAFREANEGKKAHMLFGSFETRPAQWVFRPMPPHFTNYTQWKEGWLKRRGGTLFVANEEDAKTVTAALKSK